jgi:2-iminobutanoate/2-iminopropanoate deaminase
MTRQAIHPAGAPRPVGPYSPAIRAGDTVWCSGQIALDPASGQMVGATAAEQARQALRNLEAVLAAAGCGFGDVVRCTVYLKDMNDYAAVNAVYAEFMTEPAPARVAVEVSRLPKDAIVEIDAVAWKPTAP